MTGQRTRFIVRDGLVAIPTARTATVLGTPPAPRPAEDTVNGGESSRYRLILNEAGIGPLVLMCRDFGRRHSANIEPTKACAAQESHGIPAIVRKVDRS